MLSDGYPSLLVTYLYRKSKPPYFLAPAISPARRVVNQPSGHGDLRDCIVVGVYPFGYASVYKVTYARSSGTRPCVLQEEFSFNSLHSVALSDVVVMASLLRIPVAMRITAASSLVVPGGKKGGRMSARARVYLHGVIAGIIGAAIIAILFLFLDAVTRLPLYTPTVLGAGLFVGAEDLASTEGVEVSLKLALMYTWVHWLAFIALGVIAAQLLSLTKRNLNLGLSIFLLFLILEFGFVGTWLMLAKPVLDELAWTTVLLGNLLAAIGMAIYLQFRNACPALSS